MKKLLTLLVISLFTMNVYAASGPFLLPSGSVGPKSQWDISFESLPQPPFYVKWITYNVKCDAENPNFRKSSSVVLSKTLFNQHRVSEGNIGMILLNKRIVRFSFSVVVNSKPLNSPGFLRITNFDDTDYAYIRNCVAEYSAAPLA